MWDKLKELHNKLHEQGIRLWYLRDPIKGTPSVSLTLLMIAFFLNILSLINKVGRFFGDVEGTFQLLVLTAGLYFSRSFSTSGKGKVALEDKKEEI